MRRLAATTLVCALAAGFSALAASAAADSGIRLIEAGAKFPERAFVVRLPHELSLTAGRVEVRENGRRVPSISFVPADQVESGTAVILVIDASDSMRGRAIEDAMAAARAFADRRGGNQQLGVVTFNRKARVVLAPTTDDDEIEQALATTPRLAVGTRVYDGVAAALDLLETARVSSGSMIVLSDGRDTGSRVSARTVVEAAREAHVRVFSVGIRSPQFSRRPLERLAERAGGEYSAANSSRELASIYAQLGAELANEYMLRYRSTAGPQEKVRVAVRVLGVPGVAVTGYSAPGRAAFDLTGPYHRSLADKFWRSPLTMLFVILSAAFLIAFCVVSVVRPRSRTLRRRMAEFVSLRSEDRGPAAARISNRVFVGAERSLEATQWWARFKETLELAQIKTAPIQILLWTVVATLLVAWLLATILGSAIFAVVGLAVPFAVRGWIRRKLEKRRRAFAEQLPDNLQVLSSALRAGHSFVGALSVVVDDASEPARSEFRRVVADEQLGVPLDEALKTVVRRMDNDDLDQVALVAALQRRTGGNMAEVLDRVTDTIRERFELRRMVQTLTAQGRLSRWVVSALPVVLLAAITALNPSYVEPLFSTTGGRVMLIFAAGMVVAGSLVIKKIVDIKL